MLTGILNPVVASALHALSDEYLSMLVAMLNQLTPSDPRALLPRCVRADEATKVMKQVLRLAATQIYNLRSMLVP